VNDEFPIARELFEEIWQGLGGDDAWLDRVRFTGHGALPSAFAVTDIAGAVFAAAGSALGELLQAGGAEPPTIDVDRVLASDWFDLPAGPSRLLKEPPARQHSPWMTEFETADGRWLRVQGYFPTLRARFFDGLGVPAEDHEAVQEAVRRYPGDEVEQRLVDARAAVAINRTIDEWLSHPAGAAVHSEPIAHVEPGGTGESSWEPTPGRPLAGIKVLDLTRVAAGPFATRFLAACGAEVLRLDAPGSDESAIVLSDPNEFMLGKRWALLDLKSPAGKARFLELLAHADVLVHGYRPGGIDTLVPAAERRQAKPDLVEVAMRAYGWTGPWQDRRGFDTLVQFSTGIAAATQAWALEKPDTRIPITAVGRRVDASRPRHMPVETLDLATGYQMATGAIRGLTERLKTGAGSTWRFSIARTASILIAKGEVPEEEPVIRLPIDGPYEDRIYSGAFGAVKRVRFPLAITGNPLFWERPADRAGASTPMWVSA
jgi:crotonobetainyl-CoA:carnitine CoA-transferase CaiB-like acyl-CoA transferase